MASASVLGSGCGSSFRLRAGNYDMPSSLRPSPACGDLRLSRKNASTRAGCPTRQYSLFSLPEANLTSKCRTQAVCAKATTTPLESSHLQSDIVAPKLSEIFRRPITQDHEGQGDPCGARQRHPYEELHIGERWRDIQGARDWDGLLDPMDPLLRGELLRYGDLAQATYDAFDHDPLSPYCGSCKFRECSLLEKLSLETRGYEVVQYLYGTAEISLPKFFKKSSDPEKWSKDSNWIGFVAVCTSSKEIVRLGRRDIVVAWRGTVTNLEWIENTETSLCPTGVDTRWAGKGYKHVGLKVEKGFLSLYRSKNERSRYNKTSASEQVLCTVRNLVEKYKGEHAPLSITITGHSLGGALATLCAYDIAESGINQLSSTYPLSRIETLNPQEARGLQSRVDIPITVYSFASPRVGNTAFCDRLEELEVKVLRVVNLHDFVPYVPGLIFNENFNFMHPYIRNLKNFILWKLFQDFVDMLPATYSHAGIELQLDNTVSPCLKKTWNPISTHNLEAYLHLLAGFQGKNGGWDPRLAARRDVSLVNKWSDFLESECRIPCFWWQEKNKGLIKTAEGWFALRGRDPEDIPVIPPANQ